MSLFGIANFDESMTSLPKGGGDCNIVEVETLEELKAKNPEDCLGKIFFVKNDTREASFSSGDVLPMCPYEKPTVPENVSGSYIIPIGKHADVYLYNQDTGEHEIRKYDNILDYTYDNDEEDESYVDTCRFVISKDGLLREVNYYQNANSYSSINIILPDFGYADNYENILASFVVTYPEKYLVYSGDTKTFSTAQYVSRSSTGTDISVTFKVLVDLNKYYIYNNEEDDFVLFGEPIKPTVVTEIVQKYNTENLGDAFYVFPEEMGSWSHRSILFTSIGRPYNGDPDFKNAPPSDYHYDEYVNNIVVGNCVGNMTISDYSDKIDTKTLTAIFSGYPMITGSSFTASGNRLDSTDFNYVFKIKFNTSSADCYYLDVTVDVKYVEATGLTAFAKNVTYYTKSEDTYTRVTGDFVSGTTYYIAEPVYTPVVKVKTYAIDLSN